jgi:hypothetical protein
MKTARLGISRFLRAGTWLGSTVFAYYLLLATKISVLLIPVILKASARCRCCYKLHKFKDIFIKRSLRRVLLMFSFPSPLQLETFNFVPIFIYWMRKTYMNVDYRTRFYFFTHGTELKFKKIMYFVILRLIFNILSMNTCYEFSMKGINGIDVETDAIVPLRKLLV